MLCFVAALGVIVVGCWLSVADSGGVFNERPEQRSSLDAIPFSKTPEDCGQELIKSAQNRDTACLYHTILTSQHKLLSKAYLHKFKCLKKTTGMQLPLQKLSLQLSVLPVLTSLGGLIALKYYPNGYVSPY
ncbi:hypothetical protein GQX74_005719 [Glossina fuscipes]|nr:hypothetical protein GQX74_005719 [Glossina fuscipes]